MKTIKITIILSTFALSILLTCTLEKPVEMDSTGNLNIFVIDTTGFFVENKLNPVAECRIRIFNCDYDQMLECFTDENGMIEVNNLLVGRYIISANKKNDSFKNEKFASYMLSGSLETDIYKANVQEIDTIKLGFGNLSDIVINEIYYSGPLDKQGYYADQFIELYNNSDKVQYLDGIIVSRLYTDIQYPDQYIVSARHYRFPGQGKDYPFQPDSYIVIAQDAIDHTTNGGSENSVNLSNADWEFFNQLEEDIDNPSVPNLTNIAIVSLSLDFRLNLIHDAVCIIKLDNDEDALDYFIEGKSYKIFPISCILDGIEYSPYADCLKSLDHRVDVGLAGYGISRYSGRSIERENPETGQPGYDTNNSTFDFVTLTKPTPGYQHSYDLVIP